MESSSFSHRELVKLDFPRAYRTLWHDTGVLLRALRTPNPLANCPAKPASGAGKQQPALRYNYQPEAPRLRLT